MQGRAVVRGKIIAAIGLDEFDNGTFGQIHRLVQHKTPLAHTAPHRLHALRLRACQA